MITSVIFDFDMTLVNSLKAINVGVNKIAKEFGLETKTEDDILAVIGKSTTDFWIGLWGTYDPKWRDFFYNSIVSSERDYLKSYDGVENLLSELKASGCLIGVATNRDEAWPSLRDVGLASYVDTAVGSLDVTNPKPAPDMLIAAMNQLGSVPSKTIFVGDSAVDMLAAQAAGIKGVGLKQSGLSDEELYQAGAWKVLESIKDFKSILDI